MYEPPLDVSVFQKFNDVVNAIDNELATTITTQIEYAVDVKVDKDELMRALAYDREQYKKGYDDGYKSAMQCKWERDSEIAELIRVMNPRLYYLAVRHLELEKKYNKEDL